MVNDLHPDCPTTDQAPPADEIEYVNYWSNLPRDVFGHYDPTAETHCSNDKVCVPFLFLVLSIYINDILGKLKPT